MSMRKQNRFAALVVSLALTFVCIAPSAALARSHKSGAMKDLEGAIESALEPRSQTVAAVGKVEFAFSPREGAQELVVRAIASSKHEIRMLAYALTSAPVVEALIAAKKRGVDVRVVADYKENVSADRSGKARAAMGALVTAGIEVRTISVYPIHHDKVVIVDRETVQTGSFNYTQAAAKSNSENVLVLWNNPQLAIGYLSHWERNWRQSQDWQPAY